MRKDVTKKLRHFANSMVLSKDNVAKLTSKQLYRRLKIAYKKGEIKLEA